jgi:uncharacterized protein (DUF1778 family)
VATLGYMAQSKKTPKKAGKPVKGDVIRMRVTSDQKSAIVAAAERDGLEVSAWLRQLALRAAGALPEPKRK